MRRSIIRVRYPSAGQLLVAALGLSALAGMVGILGAGRGTSVHAAPAFADIASSGPLQHVYIGNELSCQVMTAGDAGMAMFPAGTVPGDCGTFLVIGTELYAPDFFNHDGTATLFLGSYTPFTPVSQSAVSGSGSAADPYRVVTIVDAGSAGIRVTETDSYVDGADSYRTDIALQSTRAAAPRVLVYRGGECVLADAMEGFGTADPVTHAAGCATNPADSPPDRVEAWLPITPIDHHIEGWYRDVWSAIGAHGSLPDTCACDVSLQNGVAIQWDRTVAAGASLTLSHATKITPATAIATDTPTATASATNTPTPTSTSTNTSSPTATNTPSPTATNTPVPPTVTNTPLPTSTPSAIPTATPAASATCADVSGDGRVTVADVLAIFEHVGRKRYDPAYDLNHDGKVNGRDVRIVVAQLGTVCRRA